MSWGTGPRGVYSISTNTEGSIVILAHRVNFEDIVRGHIGISKPIVGTDIAILDENLSLTAERLKVFEKKPLQIVDNGNTKALLADLWCQTLYLEHWSFRPDDNIWRLGGTLLQIASLILKARQLSKADIPIGAIYQHPTLDSFAGYTEQLQAGRNHIDDEQTAWLADSQLAKDLPPLATSEQANWRGKEEGRVIMKVLGSQASICRFTATTTCAARCLIGPSC